MNLLIGFVRIKTIDRGEFPPLLILKKNQVPLEKIFLAHSTP